MAKLTKAEVARIVADVKTFAPIRKAPQHSGGPTNDYRERLLRSKALQVELKSVLSGTAAKQSQFIERIIAEYAAANPGKQFSGETIEPYDARHALCWALNHKKSVLESLLQTIARKLVKAGLDEFAKSVLADISSIKVVNDLDDVGSKSTSDKPDLTDFSW